MLEHQTNEHNNQTMLFKTSQLWKSTLNPCDITICLFFFLIEKLSDGTYNKFISTTPQQLMNKSSVEEKIVI